MAKIRVKIQEYNSKIKRKVNKTITVDVANADCKNYQCLQPGQWQTRGATGAGGSKNSGFSKEYTCMFRNYHGCPINPIKKAK